MKTNNCPVPDRARRASTINNLPTGFSSTGANSGIEGTWTSVSEKWPTWQIFRSLLIFIDLLIIQGNLLSFDDFMDLRNGK